MRTTGCLVIIVCLVFTACTKDKFEVLETGISYPDSIYYGSNILSFPDSFLIISSGNEIGAILQKDATLSVILTCNYPVDSLGGLVFGGEVNHVTGWSVVDWHHYSKTYKLVSTHTGIIYFRYLFMGYVPSSMKIDFYENGNTLTRTKTVYYR